MNILLIDNYDSFSFNLYQQVAQVTGTEPRVVHNDAVSIEELRCTPWDAVVLSPGPGHPAREGDFGVCREAIRQLDVPMLGVCLGCEGIAHEFGAHVVRAPQPMHGRRSRIRHNGSALFEGIPQNFHAVRYHSLAVADGLPDVLEPLAWADDGVLMALRHRGRPLWGVQFHPESICTEHGHRLIENFFRVACRRPARPRAVGRPSPPVLAPASGGGGVVHFRKLDLLPDPERAFLHLYGNSDHAFWLGSELVETDQSRFIFMGDDSGPHSQVISYRTHDRSLRVKGAGGHLHLQQSIFDYLRQQLASRTVHSPELPFDFNCGFAGYFGYELKAECGSPNPNRHRSDTPDSAFIFADRLLVLDRVQQCSYLVTWQHADSADARERWFDMVETALRNLPPAPPLQPAYDHGPPHIFRWARPRESYMADIHACFRELSAGESYEICLTNQLHAPPVQRPLDLYRVLRRLNPAPHAAYLRFGGLTVLSSSPEQFLRIDRHGNVSAKPIKGTVARHADPRLDGHARSWLGASEKDFSENLMIADLLRNDLGKVCQVGSVHVPKLMDVESFATVHQLVTTVNGRLRPDTTTIDCLRAAFPGGSMTGAPKLRTLAIIDRLETEARGVYSGSIGFLGLGGGADLNIVIRTLVSTPEGLSIGAGGAIVALSDPSDEFAEVLIKSRALVHAVLLAAEGRVASSAFLVHGAPKEPYLEAPVIPTELQSMLQALARTCSRSMYQEASA